MKFCTYQDSCAVLVCAKFHCDLTFMRKIIFIKFEIQSEFHQWYSLLASGMNFERLYQCLIIKSLQLEGQIFQISIITGLITTQYCLQLNNDWGRTKVRSWPSRNKRPNLALMGKLYAYVLWLLLGKIIEEFSWVCYIALMMQCSATRCHCYMLSSNDVRLRHQMSLCNVRSGRLV